jgi:branched-chain amino acid transport system substrate-binding protein
MNEFIRLALVCGLVSGMLSGCSRGPAPVVVGAVYPLSGPQGPGGREEFQGVEVAAALANRSGGVDGRPIQLRPVDVPGSDAAAAAVAGLARDGVRFVIGSYGSTISAPAAAEADRRGMLFWETGAVGEMTGAGAGRLVFRMSPSGTSLGRSAIEFVAGRLAAALGRSPHSLRYAVANVDDLYGRAVADGAVAAIQELGLPFAGRFAYDAPTLDAPDLVRRIAEAHPDVLFVSAYMTDGVALRRAMVAGHLRLTANIGTSSSYCMPAFGVTLGADAVGLFASDKPDEAVLDPSGLTPGGRMLMTEAAAMYRDRYGTTMSAAALAGFSNAWALFRVVMPRSSALTPTEVGTTAAEVTIPKGGLPNGSGMDFGPPGSVGAGANLRAASVIEEWVGVGQRAVVWPQRFATQPIRVVPIAA